ncbi:hypothetical protein ABPG72_021314 [Tetrahymena utriculariae]
MMKKTYIFAFLSLINIYLCQVNSTQLIYQILQDQGVEFVYQNNNFIVNESKNPNMTFYLENVTIHDYFTIQSNQNLGIYFYEFSLRNVIIDIKSNSLFLVNQIKIFDIKQFLFDNVTIASPLFSMKDCDDFVFHSGSIINSQLYSGFGNFKSILAFQIHNKFIDINTLQSLNEDFYNFDVIGFIKIANSTFGNYQDPSYEYVNENNFKVINQDGSLQKNKNNVRNNQNQNKKYLNFIKLNSEYGIQKVYQFENINANFQGLNMRFLIILNKVNYQTNITNCQFKNMRSLDSGGCISNLGTTVLFFTKTIFDSCLSGMFGGAIYTVAINVEDQLIIKNSKSKIGGGAFLGSQACNLSGFEKINFFNDSNKATISSQQYFYCTLQPDYYKYVNCNLFELDSIYQLNVELINTQYYQVQSEVGVKDMGTPPHIVYYSSLYQNQIYLIRLRVEYNCPEKLFKEFCSIREFNEDQSIGNLYNYIDIQYKQLFYNFEIPNAYYPYVLTSYSQLFDCEIKLFSYIFRIHLFPNANEEACSFNSRYGCYNPKNICLEGMQQTVNIQQQQTQCKYCDIGTYSDDPTNNCEVCNTNKFDKCYANNSFLKQNFWRPQNSKYNDTYFCQLNQKSCNSDNRSGYGNDLCSEGYIGAQCLVCDINGEFWNKQSYGQQGYFQCVKCSSLKNNNLFVYLSLFSVIFLFFFIIISSFKRMRKQVYRKYLSFYMKMIYIGSSFIRQNQASVYTKILMFNFQMYLLTYYFVDFDKYDSSLHGRIYNFFNPLQSSGGISYDCFLKQYFPNSESLGFIKLLISIITPLIISSFFSLVVAIYNYFRKKNLHFLIINSITYSIFFVFQSPIIQYCIESLTCIKLSSNDDFLMIDIRINCKDNYWISVMKCISIPALIIYIFIIPIIVFGYIFLNRKNLEKSKMIVTFGFMYDEYKREYYYWQFIKFLLTTFLSALVSFGKTHIILCCLIYCAILCIYSVFIIYCKPFQQILMNKLELVSIILSVLYFLSSICIQLEFKNENQYDSYKIGKIISEIFYYLVLSFQFIFYLYTIGLIILSVFYTSVQKLQKFRFFQKLVILFPSAKLDVYSKDLEINLQKFRQVVKCIMIDQNTHLVTEPIENSLNNNNKSNQQ